MIYLAYISFVFAVIQFLTALINLFFLQKVKNCYSCNQKVALVSILIPARNEERNISYILNDLINITYKNIEVIVFDDQSADNTLEIAMQISAKDKRIKIIQSSGLEKNWLGKNFACHNLAKAASGDFLLFVDADVRLYDDIIEKMLFMMRRYNLKMLSVFPLQVMKSFGERITVPVMHYVLLTLLPLIFVRKSPFISHAAANGQFMLFEAGTYNEFKPHEKFKNSAVEDIRISRFYKKAKLKIACLTGYEMVKCRMYNNYTDAVNGFAKNVLAFFGGSAVMASLFWIFNSLGFVALLFFDSLYLYVYLIVFFMTIVVVSLIARQNIFQNITYTPLRQFALLHFIIKAVFSKFLKSYKWKGRNIY